MKILIIILFVVAMLLVIALAVGLYWLNYNKQEESVSYSRYATPDEIKKAELENEQIEKKNKKYAKRCVKAVVYNSIVLIALLFGCITVGGGIYQVNAGEIAVVKTFGKITGTKDSGIHFKNIFTQSHTKYNLKVQEVEIEKECYSKDLQAVFVRQKIQFVIQANNVKLIAGEFGSLDILKQRVASLSYEAIEESAKLFDAKELVTRRNEFSSEIKDNLSGKYNNYYIDVRQLILSDIAFTEEFENMIQASKLAEQELERDKQRLEKELQEATYKVKVAEQEAKEKLAKAEGDAESKKALADALAYEIQKLAESEAEKISIIAQAEAEAVRVKLAELSSADPTSLAYLEYLAWVEAWDGSLPSTILGDNVDILFPKP